MNWKTDLRLSDLERTDRLEIACRACGKARYEAAGDLRDRPGFEFAYLDEVEHGLRCRDRFCQGRVRLSRVHDGKMEGFVGGLA